MKELNKRDKKKLLGVPLKTLIILTLLIGSVGAVFVGRFLMNIPTSPLVISENDYKIDVFNDIEKTIPTTIVIWENSVFEGDLLGITIVNSLPMYIAGPNIDGEEIVSVMIELENIPTGCTAWLEALEDVSWIRYDHGEVFTWIGPGNTRSFKICVDMNANPPGDYSGLLVKLTGGDETA